MLINFSIKEHTNINKRKSQWKSETKKNGQTVKIETKLSQYNIKKIVEK